MISAASVQTLQNLKEENIQRKNMYKNTGRYTLVGSSKEPVHGTIHVDRNGGRFTAQELAKSCMLHSLGFGTRSRGNHDAQDLDLKKKEDGSIQLDTFSLHAASQKRMQIKSLAFRRCWHLKF